MVAQKDPKDDAAYFGWTAAGSPAAPAISVVVPMFNEAGAAASLVGEIAAALAAFNHEIIVVDDSSEDETVEVLKATRQDHANLRILRHQKNAGQSRAIRTGVIAARAPVIATLDGDGQNDPIDIAALFEALKDSKGDIAMVAGDRRERRDSARKRWASTFANGLRRRLLNDGARDTGCGLKVFYREAYLRLPFFDHMHRYLPALMSREGYKLVFMPVSHRPRVYGKSKYTNIGRLVVAVRDLLGVMWLLSRAKSPESISEQED